jgi:hypothetical protein
VNPVSKESIAVKVIPLDQPSQERLLSEVIAAVEKADISARQKRVTLRRLKFFPAYKNSFLDEVLAQGFAQGYITIAVTKNNSELQEPVEIMIDWEGLIEFIERIIPLIIQLIGLFG